jgi:hypothetical protein
MTGPARPCAYSTGSRPGPADRPTWRAPPTPRAQCCSSSSSRRTDSGTLAYGFRGGGTAPARSQRSRLLSPTFRCSCPLESISANLRTHLLGEARSTIAHSPTSPFEPMTGFHDLAAFLQPIAVDLRKASRWRQSAPPPEAPCLGSAPIRVSSAIMSSRLPRATIWAPRPDRRWPPHIDGVLGARDAQQIPAWAALIAVVGDHPGHPWRPGDDLPADGPGTPSGTSSPFDPVGMAVGSPGRTIPGCVGL